MVSSKQNLVSFLQGHTANGTHPMNIAQLIFNHPYGQQKPNSPKDPQMFQPLPSYAWPPPHGSTSLPAENSAPLGTTTHDPTKPSFDEQNDWQGVTA